MNKFFDLKGKGTTVRTEIIAGITTFFTMVYIIFVIPGILAASGMSHSGVFVSTVLATVVGTLVMGLVANVPYAVAPGIGLAAFFTYTVCFALGFSWQEGLAMVFVCGVINILITVTKIRKKIIRSIPQSLQLAIGGGIGMFIAYIGLKSAGFLNFSISNAATFAPGTDVTPQLAAFDNTGILLSLAGLVIMIVLLLLNVKGAIFIGIVATTIISVLINFTPLPDKLFDMGAMDGFKEVSLAFFGDVGISSMFSDAAKIPLVIITIFAFSLSDTFDTIGTFIGTGRRSGIFDEADEKAMYEGNGFKSRMDKALFADSTATSIGALLGTSNATTYIESASGISVGGRSGLTSVVVAVLFLLCLPFSALFGMVPAQATAPALIVVGIMMMESFAGIKWDVLEEIIPAFFTVLIMAFAYNISYGIAAGFFFYCIVMLCKKKGRQIHPIIAGATVLFILNFALLAINNM